MASEKLNFSKQISIKNKKASFEYHLLEKFIAGIILQGTEIKSIRLGKVNLRDAYCTFMHEELLVKAMHISPYSLGTHYNHEPKRDRKLLLNKKELKKLWKKSTEKGLTIIPTRIFISEKGLAKLEIALAQGKKIYDKREDIKTKDMKRDLARMKL
ncbi:SsrA-binding protein SmpB [Bacteroidota bacterium]